MEEVIAWQGLIGTVLGACLAIFGGWLTNRNNRQSLKMQLDHEEKLHRQRLSKERLEELYGLVNSWGNSIYLHCIGLEKLARSEINLEEFRNHVTSPNMPQSNLGRVEMIAGIYGESFIKVFDHALNIKDGIADIDDFIVKADIAGRPYGHLADPLVSLQMEFVTCIDSFKEAIVKAAKEI